MDKQRQIPGSAVRRLTRYLALCQEALGRGAQWVSSGEIAEALGLTSSTVRQDLSHVDFSGISKRGYEIAGLQQVLRGVLGIDHTWNVVVVGAGNMGRALALHEEFPRRGFLIRGIFDADPRKVGRKVGPLAIQPMRALPAVVGGARVDIGVIAVPAAAAQNVADLLIVSGVRGLLNMTLTHVVAPRSVPVIDTRILTNLLELTHAIKFLGLPKADGGG